MSSNSGSDTAFEYIDCAEALDVFCSTISDSSWVAVDTEFIREKTYYPKLCLIQFGVPGRIACIDPLKIGDLAPVLEILHNRSIVKVLHACSQDLEIFFYLNGKVPGPIFDTQLAAPLLGLPEQMGYGNFVKEILGLALDKAQARTDWSRRPLDSAQLHYAADDVRYLAEMYPIVQKRLEELGRLDWLKAEFESYECADRYRNNPLAAWKRFRGLEKLRPAALSVVQLLAEWRELTAQKRDLPRSWILKDEVLVDIARLAPDNPERLNRIRNLPPKFVERYGSHIIDRVQTGKQREPEPLPDWKKRKKPTAQEEALADILHAQLRLLADRYRINSSVLAARKDLIALAQGDENIPILQGWRRTMAGAELLAVKDGQRTVSIVNDKVVISGEPDS